MDYTVTIYIKNGTYKEKLVIPSWVKNVQLVGESAENTENEATASGGDDDDADEDGDDLEAVSLTTSTHG